MCSFVFCFGVFSLELDLLIPPRFQLLQNAFLSSEAIRPRLLSNSLNCKVLTKTLAPDDLHINKSYLFLFLLLIFCLVGIFLSENLFLKPLWCQISSVPIITVVCLMIVGIRNKLNERLCIN